MHTIEASHLTHEEYFYLNGKLSEERTEQLIEDLHEAQAFDVREYASSAEEACAGFPSEDCLQEHIKGLRDFAKRLRGDNKQDLLSLIERVEFTQQELANSGAYGQEQLEEIISSVRK